MNWKLIRVIDSFLGIAIIRIISFLKKIYIDKNSAAINPAKILLVKFWGIGNIFMLLPAINSLKAKFPNAEINFLTLSSNYNAIQLTEVIDEIYTINTQSPISFIKTWCIAVKVLKSKEYDVIIDFEQFARFSALLTWQIGSKKNIGFKTERQHRHHLYTDSVPYNNDIHITRSFYELVIRAGVTQPYSNYFHLKNIKKLREDGKKLLSKYRININQPIAILHIGTSDNFGERRWRPKYYAALADLLKNNYNIQSILTGLAEEAPLLTEVQQHLQTTGHITNLAGKLSFHEYLTLITAADFVISADTSAVHIASAVNTPVVGLYGPNTATLYGPWGNNSLSISANLQCSPCITNFNGKINTCRHPEGKGACMAAISVSAVYKLIKNNYLLPDAPYLLQKLRKEAA